MLYPRLRVPDSSYPKPAFAPATFRKEEGEGDSELDVASLEDELISLQK